MFARTRKGKAIAIAGKKLTPLKKFYGFKKINRKKVLILKKKKSLKVRIQKKKRKKIFNGIIRQSTFNNNCIGRYKWQCYFMVIAGQKGFKGSRKSTLMLHK